MSGAKQKSEPVPSPVWSPTMDSISDWANDGPSSRNSWVGKKTCENFSRLITWVGFLKFLKISLPSTQWMTFKWPHDNFRWPSQAFWKMKNEIGSNPKWTVQTTETERSYSKFIAASLGWNETVFKSERKTKVNAHELPKWTIKTTMAVRLEQGLSRGTSILIILSVHFRSKNLIFWNSQNWFFGPIWLSNDL